MFELLNEDDRLALAKVIDEEKVSEGQTLFQAGDPGDSLFIVQSGEIELFIKDTAGQKIVLATPSEGDMFGELIRRYPQITLITQIKKLDSDVE
jgi:CRP/FNR family cyclic AMP-dependent transcriptional regulator